MNKRIRELAEQATENKWKLNRYMSDPVFDGCELDTEKFAELIVRECVQTLIDNTPVLDEYESQEDWDRGYGQAMRDCVHHIREHFGVEE